MKKAMFWAVVSLAMVAIAAPKFEKVPKQAMEMLKGARGKPFTAGLVFVNGAYQKPAYRVIRYGTAIFVNDTQVTGQIVSWRGFLATQDGYVAPALATKAAPAPAKSVDDLFDDAPVKTADSKPAEEPEVTGAFTPNAKSDKLLKKINDYRTEVQRKLKDGYVIFFGSRYARVAVEPRIAKNLIAILPEAIRDAADGAELTATLRTKGFPFMIRPLCDDLVEHRADYLQIVERRSKMKEEEQFRKMLDGQGRGW